MNKIVIYHNRKKSFLKIIAGISLIAMLFIPRLGIFRIWMFFAGGSLIYFGLKSFSGKPQIIISDEGLFLAFGFNKTVSWKSIESVAIHMHIVDGREVDFLVLDLRVKAHGPHQTNSLKKEFRLESLEKSSQEIFHLIQSRVPGR